jgi:hypothetical protein
METIDDGGEWWLPETPERRIAGWLTFTVDEGARLRLTGSFSDFVAEGVRREDGSIAMTEDSLERAGTYPRILGQIGNKAFTLDGCFRMRLNRNLFGGLASETIHADRIYRGVWYERGEEACGDGIRIALAHLVYWIRPSTMGEEWRWREPGKKLEDPLVALSARNAPSIVLERQVGTIKLSQHLGLSGDRVAHRAIVQDFVAQLDTDGVRPVRDLIRAVAELQDVVSLAMDRVACIEAVSLFHPDLVDERPNDRAHRRPIDMFARWSDRSAWTEPKDLTPSDVLFHYDAVGEEGLRNLLDTAATYAPELRRVMASRREQSMYSSDRLLNRCAALESFDRKRVGQGRRAFRKRIRAAITLAGPPFQRLVHDTEAWLRVLERRRNHVAHHLENDDERDGLTDLLIADSTYFLFVLCLLREASMPSKVFDLFEENRRVQWLRRQLPEATTTSASE